MVGTDGLGVAGERDPIAVSSVRGRIVVLVGALALLLLIPLAWGGSVVVSRFLARQADSRLLDASRRSALIIEQLLLEREREVRLLASSPAIVDAVSTGSARARTLGLADERIDDLEIRFDRERSLAMAPRVERYLRDAQASLDAAEILVTEAHGYNVVTTQRTSDFVQRDESWWQQAVRDGLSRADASYDESARQTVLSISSAIRETGSDSPLGVIKVAFNLAKVDDGLARASEIAGIAVDLVDAAGNVIASSSNEPRMRPLPGAASLADASVDSIIRYDAEGVLQRAAILPVNHGRWRLVSHLDESRARSELWSARAWLAGIAITLFALVLLGLLYVGHDVAKRVSAPAAELARVAEAVAGGNLAVRVGATESTDEIGRLTRATGRMIADLRRLALALRSSSQETASMSTEITIGTEHMASAAQEMAHTSGDLSHQSTEMAQTLQELAGNAGRLVGIAAELDAGASEGVARNTQLRALAGESRERLDANATALQHLESDIQSSAAAVESLAGASEEVRAFVTFVQKMARQSRLLALNAAMEAARAGEQGQGFAVVATEVRRLATSAAEAAERTEALVAGVLTRVAESRESSARTVDTVREVLSATQQGLDSFGQIESAVADTEAWTATIDKAANTTNDLVNDTTMRIEQLARGTESFAAAMEQVAASAEEQSASTQEIAAAAARLSSEAERLAKLAATFRLDGDPGPGNPATRHPAPESGNADARTPGRRGVLAPA